MKTIGRRGTRSFVASLGLLVLILGASAGIARAGAPASPETIITIWPVAQRAVARALIEKYGRPSQFDSHALVWFNNGDWKRTIVYRKGLNRRRGRDKDFLQQTVGYIVPNDKVAALKRFDSRLEVSTTAGELTFTSEREATNLLALNLAAEIVAGKRSVASARYFFTKTSLLALSGKSSPYRESIRFGVDNSRYMTPSGADR